MHVISSRNIPTYLSILQKVIGEDTVDTTFRLSFCEVIRSDPIADSLPFVSVILSVLCGIIGVHRPLIVGPHHMVTVITHTE